MTEEKINIDLTVESQEVIAVDTNVFQSNAKALLSASELKFCREAQARFKAAQVLLRRKVVRNDNRYLQ